MASHKVTNYISFSGLLVIAFATLPLISSENIDCKGKAFHCVNSTHFKICVDLGGGVSKTVDEFLIPCPRSTACNDINKFECEYQVTTTLSSTQQSDVVNDLVDLGTTLAWDNIDINALSPENVTNNSSADTTETSNLITVDINTFIPSTTLAETFNQVNSSSANNINITSYLSDSDTVTNTYDSSTINTNVPLNDTVLNSTSNKSVTVISGELSLSKTVQDPIGATELSIDVPERNNANTYDNNKEYGNTINIGTLTLGKIVGNPVSYSTETTSFLSDSYTSTTPVSVLSNLEINSKSEDILKTTSQYTSYNNKPLTTITSESLTDTKLNISENIRSIDNNTKETLSKANTNVYNEWKGFTMNIFEQNNLNKTETLLTSTELSSTNSVESSTEYYKNVDLTTPTRKNNDRQNSENIVTTPRYTSDLYTVSGFQNNSADLRISPTIDNQITIVENKSDVINVLNLADSLPVTHYADLLSEVVRKSTIATNKSLSDILISKSPLQIEITENHFSNLTDTSLKTPGLEDLSDTSNFSALNDIHTLIIGDIKDIHFINIHENNVTNNSMYKEATEGLSIDKQHFDNNNANNFNSVHVNNNNSTYLIENITSTAGLYKTTLAVDDAAFSFVTSPPLRDTNPVNVNFTYPSTTTTQYISIPEYYQPTTIANRKINENLEPSSSDLILDINKPIPNETAAIKTFDKDNKDSMSLNKIFFSTNENITVPLIDTTTINSNQEIITFQNEDLSVIKNKIFENITVIENSTVKTAELINLSNFSYNQLNLNSSELTTLNDSISIQPYKIHVNNSKSSLNETNLRVPDITNDILYTTNHEIQSNVNQAVTENLNKVSSTENNNLISVDGLLNTAFPIQTQTLITLKSYEKTDEVNAKNIDVIGTNEASTAAVSSILPKTSYKELKEMYRSVTSLLLGTTKPYIYKIENITISDPSRYINYQNHIDQQNTSNSNVGNLDSGSSLYNSSESMSKIQDLNVSNNVAGFNLEDSFRSTPFQMKITTSPFHNSFSVDSTLDLPSNTKNKARTTSPVGILENNSNNSISTTNSLNNNNQTLIITTNKINVINNEVLIGTHGNVTLAQNIDKTKSDLKSADASIDSKNSSNFEWKSTSNFELSQNLQLSNDNALQYNENENNVNIIPVLSKTNNSTRFLKQNEAEINETLKLLQADSNLTSTESNLHLSNIVKNQSIPTTTVESWAIKLNNSPLVDNQTTPLEQFTCVDRGRGKYSDKSNCNKFYICMGKLQPIIGMCPEDTVFSEIRKQCTSNLSHCIRNNQFRCLSSGRFIDVLSDIFYYICVKKRDGYVRYKLQCQKGYYLNKENIQCSSDTASIENNSNTTSDRSTNEVKSEDISRSANYETLFECEKEGKFEHSGDCRKYFICSKTAKSKFRRKIKKCSSDEVYNKEKGKCVDADSEEC